MRHWMRLVVHIPEKSFAPDDIRKLLARLSSEAPEEKKIPLDVFHYDQSGNPKSSLSPFRFGGSKGALHIHAVGSDSVDLLQETGHRITNLLGRHYGQPLPEHRYAGKFPGSLDNLSYLKTFRIPFLVFADTPKKHQSVVREAKTQELNSALKEMMENTIRRGIVAQAEYLLMDLPDGFTLGIDGADYFVPVKVKPGAFYLGARNVVFRCSLKLGKTPWHVGYLKSRGYGLICLDHSH